MRFDGFPKKITKMFCKEYCLIVFSCPGQTINGIIVEHQRKPTSLWFLCNISVFKKFSNVIIKEPNERYKYFKETTILII